MILRNTSFGSILPAYKARSPVAIGTTRRMDDTSFHLIIYKSIHTYQYIYIYTLLSIIVVTQIRGNMTGSSPPLPTTVRALHFFREKIAALPSSTRVEYVQNILKF